MAVKLRPGLEAKLRLGNMLSGGLPRRPGKCTLAIVHETSVLHSMSCLSVKARQLASSRARDPREGERQQEEPKEKPQWFL